MNAFKRSGSCVFWSSLSSESSSEPSSSSFWPDELLSSGLSPFGELNGWSDCGGDADCNFMPPLTKAFWYCAHRLPTMLKSGASVPLRAEISITTDNWKVLLNWLLEVGAYTTYLHLNFDSSMPTASILSYPRLSLDLQKKSFMDFVIFFQIHQCAFLDFVEKIDIFIQTHQHKFPRAAESPTGFR